MQDFSWVSLPSSEALQESLQSMLVIRRFEEKAAEVYTLGKIGGFCHLCIGQEAIPVASVMAMEPCDSMITAYRCHGHALAKGLSPRQVMAELMGKSPGCSKGKGGSMHLFDVAHNFYGGHGIVGAQVPLGTGLGLSHKTLCDGGVCLTFLGDGATNQGQFFEAMNMAALWHIPVLYIIENNGYSMGTSVARGCAGPSLGKRGEAFGIQGITIEGHDFIEVYKHFKGLLEHVRKTSFPFLLEIQTHRFKGHSVSDPGKYRSRQDLDYERKTYDPLHHLERYLQTHHDVSEETIATYKKMAQERVSDAISFSDEATEPLQAELTKDILVV